VVSKRELKERATVREAGIIGVDLAEGVFQVHGTSTDASWSARAYRCRRFPVSPPVEIEPDDGSNLS
jgi:hypothetical protein